MPSERAIENRNSDIFSKTFDNGDKNIDNVLYPSLRSAFSYAPKYYKPSTSFSKEK